MYKNALSGLKERNTRFGRKKKIVFFLKYKAIFIVMFHFVLYFPSYLQLAFWPCRRCRHRLRSGRSLPRYATIRPSRYVRMIAIVGCK